MKFDTTSQRILDHVVNQYRLDETWFPFDESNAVELIGINLKEAMPYFEKLKSQNIIDFKTVIADLEVSSIGVELTPYGKTLFNLK